MLWINFHSGHGDHEEGLLMRKVLVMAAAVGVAVVTGTASAGPAVPFTDAAGDGTTGTVADITDVAVSNTKNVVKFQIHFPNVADLRCQLASVFIDADADATTGIPGSGVDYEFTVTIQPALCPTDTVGPLSVDSTRVVIDSTGAWTVVPDASQEATATWKSSKRVLRFTVARSPLGNPKAIRFIVATHSMIDDGMDVAPGAPTFGLWSYALKLNE
jgi:hypothetical protein